jgi:hypothetical protein
LTFDKMIVVSGATGQQGGSVARHLLARGLAGPWQSRVPRLSGLTWTIGERWIRFCEALMAF